MKDELERARVEFVVDLFVIFARNLPAASPVLEKLLIIWQVAKLSLSTFYMGRTALRNLCLGCELTTTTTKETTIVRKKNPQMFKRFIYRYIKNFT